MIQQQKKLIAAVVMVLFLLLVASACESGTANTGNGSTQNQGFAPATMVTRQVVIPKSASGSPGKGPLVISSPTPVPGGKIGSEQVVLTDRTLIMNSVSKHTGANPNTMLITLDLDVQNISGKAIANQPSFFQLIGDEGDIFSYQYNSSDTFYGPIAAHTTRPGIIVFELPAAAASNLRLFYRPENATEAAIIVLNVS